MARNSKPHLFPQATQDEMLATIKVGGGRNWVHPLTSRGRFLSLRKWIGLGLIAFFLLAPHFTLGGKPLVFFHLAKQQFSVFGATFHPTDNVILMVLGLSVVWTVFIATSVFGRVWCGFLCPQPVYLEFIYRPIEQFFEGPPYLRKRRESQPPDVASRVRNALKLMTFFAFSALLAHTFVAYFIGWDSLMEQLGSSPSEHKGVFFAVAFTTALVLFDFTYFREQMCTVTCPYGRLQTLLYDKDTQIIGYNPKRGEPRGSIRLTGENSEVPTGDCIDCTRCVKTCPTGIDIRRGLQMECIGCAQCIDACDSVMQRIGKSPGLIGYTSLKELDGGKTRWLRPRVVLYALVSLTIYSTFAYLLMFRAPADVQLMRTGRDVYKILPTGDVANQLVAHMTNRTDETQSFELELVEPKNARFTASISPFVLDPQAHGSLDLVVTLERDVFRNGRLDAVFRVKSDKGLDLTKEFLLLGPYR